MVVIDVIVGVLNVSDILLIHQQTEMYYLGLFDVLSLWMSLWNHVSVHKPFVEAWWLLDFLFAWPVGWLLLFAWPVSWLA